MLCYRAMTMMNAEPSSRERILRAGVALMSQSGLSGVTLGVLADKVKMSKSGLFAHFRSKEAVQIEPAQSYERVRGRTRPAPVAGRGRRIAPPAGAGSQLVRMGATRWAAGRVSGRSGSIRV